MSASAVTTPSPAWRASALAPALDRLRRDEPVQFGAGVLLLAAMSPTAAAALADDRLFQGLSVWEKPWKFELALTVYCFSLAFFARFLPQGWTGRPAYRVFSAAVAVAIGLELTWIAGAAALGTASHFNASPIGAAIYPAMGLMATLLTSASAVYAVGVARNAQTGLSPAVKLSLVLGLALVPPLTLVTAGFMSAHGGHAIGAAPGESDAGGLLLLGWSREHGDLRVAHFFATHAMHALPLAGLASALLFGGARRGPVLLACVLYLGLVAFAFVGALRGEPFPPGF